MREINFDGLVGPSHNYAGLSFGNRASASHAGEVSRPRVAALQGLGKMRRMMELGLRQGVLLPHERPLTGWLRQFGFSGTDDAVCAAAWRNEPGLLRTALSASPMWTANAATVSPAPDTADGRCHISAANLCTMLHRSIEAPETTRQLGLLFADTDRFALHPALPAGIGDEGAANMMRLCPHHGAPGLEILVYGETRPDGFPARQSRIASAAVARRHGLAAERTLLARQSDAAIQAGAFHNDVVAVANESVLLVHEQAFADQGQVYDAILRHVSSATILEVPASLVSLEDAIRSYLFNAQLITLPEGGMALIVPDECRRTGAVAAWLDAATSGNGPVRRVESMNLRESMQNGGGPACLRLRIVLDDVAEAALDQRFLLDEAKLEGIATVIDDRWPERISPDDLGHADLWEDCRNARRELLDFLGFAA
ncbi:N-succinylarginine dihydrolase [Acetobacter oeni]|uniref:N-succinylarginine dihydrolase n=1 Tax=Acetobacter oeni TaxID=304077 RepID=A0A511XJ14_9PROT|nr:N-succinylarginine dihydrolase [Acetobacter oeni]MBB3882645.1 succinylarginine dihydrolase [Acetobacter oeni]NHO18749.1 N-succinylarginine dihydrolase [Acetobacter oeni]GBR06597.1 succinylarginine dihydrolase [Acetobacter oeni LMG 21952]GEN62901.1 N-succinylarginine dihydrolase [Acetobacter oeni]